MWLHVSNVTTFAQDFEHNETEADRSNLGGDEVTDNDISREW